MATVVGNAIAKLKVQRCQVHSYDCGYTPFFSQEYSPKSQVMMGILSDNVQKGLPFKTILYNLCKSTAEAAYADTFQLYLVQSNVRFLSES